MTDPQHHSPLDPIRQDAEGYLREAEAIEYRNHAGLSAEGGLAALHERFPRVNDPASLAAVEAALAGSPPGDARLPLELLREMLLLAAIQRETDPISDAIMEREARAVLAVADARIPYRAAPAEVSREPERARRREIEAARARALRDFEPLHRDLWRGTREACEKAGHGDLAKLVAATSTMDLEAIAGSAAAFLRDTADLYRDYLGWLAPRKLGVELGELESHDLSHLFFQADAQPFYRSDRLVPLADATVRGMGLSLDADGRIALDLEARPGKSSRAFCSRLDIPSRIALVIYPRGGLDDYEAFFHELGHALHFAHVNAALPFERRWLDDSAVTEAWAFTLESLTANPIWVESRLEARPGKDFFRSLKLAKLFLVRRYAAKLAYELDLWRTADLAPMSERYAGLLREATLSAYPREGYLADVDPAFYVARYLRGWMLSSQIVEMLRERFDEGWFRSPRAGEWLRGEWSVGAIRAQGVSARAGFAELDAAALTREFLEAF